MMNTDWRDVLRYQFPPLLWMLLIFVSSSIPGSDFPAVNWMGWAKIIHLVFYSTLCFLTWRAMHYQTRFDWLARHSAAAGFAVAFVYGSLDEIHQMFTLGRHPRATDVLIDCAGACLFLLGLQFYKFLRRLDSPVF